MKRSLLMLLLCTATTLMADVYNQPFDMSGNAYASQNDTASFGNFATMYDNFILGSATNLTGASWTGEYFDPPTQGPITAWQVSIYADNMGQPGAALYTNTYNDTGNETFLGNFGGFPVYTYSEPINFAAAAGTTYWLSVVPSLAFPPQWGWATGTGGDGISYQDFFGSRSQQSADMAFSLQGNSAVPEPSFYALTGAALALVLMVGRRQRKADNNA